jgi:hypothetical protein
MKKEKVIERILDYLKNQEFYEALFKEIEADIRKDLIRARKINKNPGYRSHK